MRWRRGGRHRRGGRRRRRRGAGRSPSERRQPLLSSPRLLTGATSHFSFVDSDRASGSRERGSRRCARETAGVLAGDRDGAYRLGAEGAACKEEAEARRPSSASAPTRTPGSAMSSNRLDGEGAACREEAEAHHKHACRGVRRAAAQHQQARWVALRILLVRGEASFPSSPS